MQSRCRSSRNARTWTQSFRHLPTIYTRHIKGVLHDKCHIYWSGIFSSVPHSGVIGSSIWPCFLARQGVEEEEDWWELRKLLVCAHTHECWARRALHGRWRRPTAMAPADRSYGLSHKLRLRVGPPACIVLNGPPAVSWRHWYSF
jgi:hypothetical protein